MLSDHRIIKERIEGNIVIEPFREDFLGTNSYDCRLGPWYYKSNPSIAEVFLDDPDGVAAYWRGPFKAEWNETRQQSYIAIAPATTILAHTQEVVGGKNGYLAKMHSKSTTARYGLSVCRCAGVGDVGYINIWTMEIHNGTQNIIWMPVGMKICQFIFEDVGETLKEYKGNYGQNPDFKPEDMLPKAAKIAR